jgi:hypothetical protein
MAELVDDPILALVELVSQVDRMIAVRTISVKLL